MANGKKTLVFTPTYNERDNVEKLCGEIIGLRLNVDILFLDDNSPDGTGNVLDGLAKRYPNVKVIHRSGKLGIGSAHFDGINWAYDHQYATLITMDCDFSHPTKYLPELIRNSENHDVVVGSRHLLKGSDKELTFFRRTLTSFGHVLTKYLLGMPYDATGAYRLYRLDKIPRQAFDLIHSKGYSFFFESLYLLHMNKFCIKEVPITILARTYGRTKMSLKDVLYSVQLLVRIYLTTSIDRKRYEIPKPFNSNA